MTQTYPCTVCKADSLGGGSILHGGVFFKLCPSCLEDEETMRKLNEYWQGLDEDDDYVGIIGAVDE